jgi:hypothetical protein
MPASCPTIDVPCGSDLDGVGLRQLSRRVLVLIAQSLMWLSNNKVHTYRCTCKFDNAELLRRFVFIERF